MKKTIESWWEELREGEESSMYKFQQSMKGLKAKIKKWNKEEFGNIFLDKKMLEKRLQEIQTIGTNEGYTLEIKNKKLSLCSKLEERKKQ